MAADHPLVQRHGSQGYHLWVHMIWRANYADDAPSEGTPRGSLDLTTRQLSEETGIPPRTVARILNTMEELRMVEWSRASLG